MNKKSNHKSHVLVIGGAGYIGTHMVRLLLENDFSPIVFDNLSTGNRRFVPKGVPFVKGDLRIQRDIDKVFEKYAIDSVIHFSAASLVYESVTDPIKYYDNNVISFVRLLASMRRNKIRKIIFSSTAATFGEPKRIPIRENDVQDPTNPYGQSKLMMEKIIMDSAKAYRDIDFTILRYFNVAGAWGDNKLGEVHNPETHIVPNILKSLLSKSEKLKIYGNDYQTRDGTCLRDYVHVVDLCEAHLLALKKMNAGVKNEVFNLGTDKGTTLLELIKSVEKVTGKKVEYEMCNRRPGDPARLVASNKKAKDVLGWSPRYNLNDIIESAWKWEVSLQK